MGYLEVIASKIPEVQKIMLTVFTCNERAVKFYKDISFDKDEYSPRPKRLRNGTLVEADYMIMSKPMSRRNKRSPS